MVCNKGFRNMVYILSDHLYGETNEVIAKCTKILVLLLH
jgi:hypothetical protein